MPRERELKSQITEGLEEVTTERIQAALDKAQAEFDKEFARKDGLGFVWAGEPADSNSDVTLKRAFHLAGEGQFIERYESWGVLEWYYISDAHGVEGDSRSLGNKYDDARVHPGNHYFINRI